MGQFFLNLRRDFPLLAEQPRLVYLDSAATSQKPCGVLRAMARYYGSENANTHRAAYELARRSTERFEEARAIVAQFLGAANAQDIAFTTGTTMGINTVAYAWAQRNLVEGDVVLFTQMEHHSNIVPWQELAKRTGIRCQAVFVTDDGVLDLDHMEYLLSHERVKLVSVAHVSNVLATRNPVAHIARMAHKYGAAILVDGAQAAGHMPVNVVDLGVDFYAMSAHKALGPMGIGALYVHPNRQPEMGPFFGGGEMITDVTLTGSTYKKFPQLLEAGTQNVGGAVGMAAAMRYLMDIGMDQVEQHVARLGAYARANLQKVQGIKLLGPNDAANSAHSLVCFTFDYDGAPAETRVHNDVIVAALDQERIAVRSGRFCAQPIIERMGVMPDGAIRASFGVYNTFQDVDKLLAVVSMPDVYLTIEEVSRKVG